MTEKVHCYFIKHFYKLCTPSSKRLVLRAPDVSTIRRSSELKTKLKLRPTDLTLLPPLNSGLAQDKCGLRSVQRNWKNQDFFRQYSEVAWVGDWDRPGVPRFLSIGV